MKQKQYEELGFTDDFMFCKVLSNHPELCHELLELILGKKIGQFVKLEKQKPIEITSDGKGIRFDVYSEDDKGSVFDCEMQTTQNVNLPKRSRYYQGMIDLNLIERGADYNELKKSYVIFICPFDVFRKGLHKYTFENICVEDTSIRLKDDAVKIFLCAGGTADDVSDDLAAFLEYISGKTVNNRFVNELDEAVERAKKHEEWRMEYMTLLMRDQEMIKKGIAEGIAKGMAEGKQKERNTLMEISDLLRKGKTGDELIQMGFDKDSVELALCLRK